MNTYFTILHDTQLNIIRNLCVIILPFEQTIACSHVFVTASTLTTSIIYSCDYNKPQREFYSNKYMHLIMKILDSIDIILCLVKLHTVNDISRRELGICTLSQSYLLHFFWSYHSTCINLVGYIILCCLLWEYLVGK